MACADGTEKFVVLVRAKSVPFRCNIPQQRSVLELQSIGGTRLSNKLLFRKIFSDLFWKQWSLKHCEELDKFPINIIQVWTISDQVSLKVSFFRDWIRRTFRKESSWPRTFLFLKLLCNWIFKLALLILLKIQSFASKSIEKKSPSTQRKFHGLLNPFSREIARLDFNAAPPPKEIFHFTLFFFWQKRKKVFERNFFFQAFYLQHFAFFPLLPFYI